MTRRSLLSTLAACLTLPWWPWRRLDDMGLTDEQLQAMCKEPFDWAGFDNTRVEFRNCKCGRYRLADFVLVETSDCRIKEIHEPSECKFFDWQPLTVTSA